VTDTQRDFAQKVGSIMDTYKRVSEPREDALPPTVGAFVDRALTHLGPIQIEHHQALEIGCWIQNNQATTTTAEAFRASREYLDMLNDARAEVARVTAERDEVLEEKRIGANLLAKFTDKINYLEAELHAVRASMKAAPR
jgi:hypothetical protein